MSNLEQEHSEELNKQESGDEIDERFGIPKEAVIHPELVEYPDSTKRWELEFNNFWVKFFGKFDEQSKIEDYHEHDVKMYREMKARGSTRYKEEFAEKAESELRIWNEFRLEYPELYESLKADAQHIYEVHGRFEQAINAKNREEIHRINDEDVEYRKLNHTSHQEIYPLYEKAYKILVSKGYSPADLWG